MALMIHMQVFCYKTSISPLNYSFAKRNDPVYRINCILEKNFK